MGPDEAPGEVDITPLKIMIKSRKQIITSFEEAWMPLSDKQKTSVGRWMATTVADSKKLGKRVYTVETKMESQPIKERKQNRTGKAYLDVGKSELQKNDKTRCQFFPQPEKWYKNQRENRRTKKQKSTRKLCRSKPESTEKVKNLPRFMFPEKTLGTWTTFSCLFTRLFPCYQQDVLSSIEFCR